MVKESDFLMSVKTFSALAAAEWKAVLALETRDGEEEASIFVRAQDNQWNQLVNWGTKMEGIFMQGKEN